MITRHPTQYQHLEHRRVRATVDSVQRRIEARFCDRGLSGVAGELGDLVDRVAGQTDKSHDRVLRTTVAFRVIGGLIVLVTAVALWLTLKDAGSTGPARSIDWLPLTESIINDVVYVALAVVFLWAVPERLERRNLLALLHRLRSLAHVIDMHQLAKDPEQVEPDYVPTAMSLPHDLDADQLHHYFDYCSELLSLTAKAAALCAEFSSDGVVLDTISDLERLTSDLSSKIWQKISLLP